jgi:fumarate hydratase subunit beta
VKKITLPFKPEELKSLKAGDLLLLSGKIITGRDVVHRRFCELIKKGQPLPVEIKDQILFYAGPIVDKNNNILSVGPTTASRMDPYTEPLLKFGMIGTIGKGTRSKEVRDLFSKYGAVYFLAIGGTAALLAKKVKRTKLVAYPEFGPEALYELEVMDFPVIVAYDLNGGDLFEKGIKEFSDL